MIYLFYVFIIYMGVELEQVGKKERWNIFAVNALDLYL